MKTRNFSPRSASIKRRGGETVKTRMTALYALGHFLVDFACAFLMFHCVRDSETWVTAALLYNFCAFALQMPLGLIADSLRRDRSFAVLGCVLVCLSGLLWKHPLPLSVLAGIGNAFYHVGGGVAVLHAYPKRLGPLGLFVSPGAFGIFFGTMLGKAHAPAFPGCIALLIMALLLIFFAEGERPPELDTETRNAPIAALVCLFLVVVLRSYLGFLFSFPWKTGVWAVIATCGVMLGKTAGGYVSDCIGAKWTSILSLGAAALLFLLSGDPVCGVLAIFLFNMSMPITLRAASDALPGMRGFSFGLLTFALFLGFLPVWSGMAAPDGAWFLALGAAVSLGLLLPGLGKRK